MSGSPKDWSVQQWAQAKVVEIFGADLRSLATFRIVLALLVLFDIANRSTDLSAHYADSGIMPRTVLVEQVLSPWAFSLHLMNGAEAFQALLFGVAALAAFGMLVGYRTRLMTFVLWALLLSIQSTAPRALCCACCCSGACYCRSAPTGRWIACGLRFSVLRHTFYRWPPSVCSCRSRSSTGSPPP